MTMTQTKTKTAALAFLEHKRIAVTGVSAKKPKEHGANVVYDRLLARGYDAVPVNPNATEIEGHPAYPDLKSIPGGVEAVVIGTKAEYADATMHEAVDLGITDVWMHRSFGAGSVSDTATQYGRDHGVTVIDGGCPLMYGPTSDPGHKIMCAFGKLTGKVPRVV